MNGLGGSRSKIINYPIVSIAFASPVRSFWSSGPAVRCIFFTFATKNYESRILKAKRDAASPEVSGWARALSFL
ncbi:MAG: hypothetical protein CFE23_10040 [Flavobacterium sp. BFFFF1]|nr:MAG: hypothetical protein CFE23_10040 [Flavobacterium sp. BFFFF1]